MENLQVHLYKQKQMKLILMMPINNKNRNLVLNNKLNNNNHN